MTSAGKSVAAPVQGRPRKNRSYTWVAYVGDDYAGVLEALDLAHTNRQAAGMQAPAMAAQLANGWRVILFNEYFHSAVNPGMLRAMSAFGHVLSLTEHEGGNEGGGTYLELHSKGRKVWGVSPNPWKGPTEFTMDGEVPDVTFRLLALALERHKAGVDRAVCDVPSELARAVCGFSIDHMQGLDFVVLDPVVPPVLPRTREGMYGILLESLTGILAPLGFSHQKGQGDTGNENVLMRHTPEGSQALMLFVWDKDGAVTADLWIDVRNRQVDAIKRPFESDPDYYPTARIWVARALGRPGVFMLSTRRGVADFMDMAQNRLPALCEACRDISQLDGLVNGESTETDIDAVVAPVVLAWLASNPRFEALAASAALRTRQDAEDEGGWIAPLVSHLRTEVKPLG